MREDLPGMTRWECREPTGFLVVSFFTAGFYMREAFDLMRSCQQYHLPHHIEQIPSLGAWGPNCNAKPHFLMGMDTVYPDRPLVWIDADARIRNWPRILRSVVADVGYYTHKGTPCGGTIYLRPGAQRRRLLEVWALALAADPIGADLAPAEARIGTPDQFYFARSVRALGLSVHALPESYCYMYDYSLDRAGDDPRPGYVPVVEHMQGSRWARRCGDYPPPTAQEPPG